MGLSDGYYADFAVAYVRGEAMRARGEGGGGPSLPDALLSCPLGALTDAEREDILATGKAAGLKMYHFKVAAELPRVRYALGVLRALRVGSLLDVGSGRGAFLWPCMAAFPHLSVTAADLLPARVEFLRAVRDGGADNLRAIRADICALDEPDQSYDEVTMLEVLEHIPDAAAAVKNAVRLARRYVVASVPSRPDDNPEHIHLFTRESLTKLFSDAGCARLRFEGVNGHILLLAGKEK